MLEKMTKDDVTQEVKDAVAEYLARRVIAETLRDEVDKVARVILKNYPLYTEPRHGMESERIFEPSRTWLAAKENWEPFYDLKDAELRAAGLKPAEMEKDFCPALVAENEQLKAEWALLDAAGIMLEMGMEPGGMNDWLLCRPSGLAKRQEFIDLTVGLVVNL